jgi:hypothetical protein
MSKKDRIFIIWSIILVPLVALCVISGGIIVCFNEQVGLIFLGIGVCGMLLCVMIPYIIWCIGGLIKLVKDED